MARLFFLRLFESFFRHRWLYTLPIVLMMIASGVALYLAPPAYRAQATMYVQGQSLLSTLTLDVNNGFGYVTPAQATATGINELMQTEAFVRAAIGSTGLNEQMALGPEVQKQMIADYRRNVIVGALGSNLISFSAKDRDPVIAKQLVDATIDTFIKWKINNDRQESVVAQNFFADLTKPYEEEVTKTQDSLQQYLKEHPDPPRGVRPTSEQTEISQLQAAVTAASDRLKAAQEKEENARLALLKAESDVRQQYSVVDLPVAPTEPEVTMKSLVQQAAIFVVIGVILSIGGVLGGALLDRTFRFPLDVRQGLSLPVLTNVPAVRKKRLVPVVTPSADEVPTSTSEPEMLTDARPQTSAQ